LRNDVYSTVSFKAQEVLNVVQVLRCRGVRAIGSVLTFDQWHFNVMEQISENLTTIQVAYSHYLAFPSKIHVYRDFLNFFFFFSFGNSHQDDRILSHPNPNPDERAM
jgi:hypothetical protein